MTMSMEPAPALAMKVACCRVFAVAACDRRARGLVGERSMCDVVNGCTTVTSRKLLLLVVLMALMSGRIPREAGKDRCSTTRCALLGAALR